MNPDPRLCRLSFTRLLLSSLVALGLAGCGNPFGTERRGEDTSLSPEDAQKEPTLTVFAASSLTDAFSELASVFERQNPGTRVRASFGASSTVLAQIQQGAPADVFASADEEKMSTAVRDGLVAGRPRIFATNREVVVVPEANPAGIRSFRDLGRPEVELVLAQEGVPATEYAERILGSAEAEYGDGFKRAVLSNVVSREANVRASVNRVALGDADATLGYASDLTPGIRDRVEAIPIPQRLNVISRYPAAALRGARSPGLAQKWLALLTSDRGQRVLISWGFEPAP